MRDVTPLQFDVLTQADTPFPESFDDIGEYESDAQLAARNELEQLGLLEEVVYDHVDGYTVTVDCLTERGRIALAVHRAVAALGGE